MKLTDFLNSINVSKKNVIRESGSPVAAAKMYVPFVTARCYSNFPDTVLIANELNVRGTSSHNVTSQMHYEFLLHAISPKKRFAKWNKPDKDEKINLIMQIYKYNYDKAKSVSDILTDEDCESLRQLLYEGGKK